MSTGAAVFAGMAIGTIVMVSIISLVLFVLEVIALWKIFTKAGEKGWKALIPIYHLYVLIRLTWDKKFFWIILLLGILTGVCNAGLNGGCKFVALPWIAFAVGIALFVLAIIAAYRLCQAFGHGGGWTVGLLFLQTIFVLMLAFGKSEYKGNVYLENKK